MAIDAAEPERKRKDAVASISGQIRELSPGERATLRRMTLTESYAADGLVIKLMLKAEVEPPADPVRFAPWRLLAHVAALLSGTTGAPAHAPRPSFGAALHSIGYSELRFLRLTAARGLPLHDQIIRAARTLARAGSGPVDLRPIPRLAGTDGYRAEQARLEIARDYYTATARSEGETK